MHKQFLGSLALGSLAAIAPLVLAAPARADALDWTYSPTTQQLEITVSGGTPRYFLAAEPARIVLDLPNTEVDPIATEQNYSTGAIRQIRIAQFQPGQARLVMELAPGTVLAPGQVELRRVNGDRWVLRPLLVGETAATRETAVTRETATLPPAASGSVPRTIATPSMVFPGAAPSTSATPTPASSDASLPPLEPGALAIPVEVPPAESPGTPAAVPSSPAPSSPAPSSSEAIALSVPPPASPAQPIPPIAASPAPLTTLPADLPPATQPRDRATSAIRVPAIAPTAPTAPPVQSPVQSPLPVPSRQSSAQPLPQPAPLTSEAPPVSLSVLPPAASNVIEFGQPLAVAAVVIPAGTVLNLRYAGREPIALSNASQQEVLLLVEAVRDRSGNVIIPANSEVIGRFETSDAGSQFITQSINWQDQTLLLNAESEVLRGNRRFLGLLGQRSRLRQIQPNQPVKVRLIEDLVR
ncbi:MAG: AMIN domain-containing protein [Drouetiella hepatica Uher 2000/2452]|jgi:hypothetical protein|uniref:AMIN domain-containing protein n=1 Tax=Drouetiella hepatica Uher 2000/2452 TaxID=904376 RepID=A0A951QAC0_9CYAN|nr:AMIN domain-containing protein [Drouetiella hepatica Uher 2000/2452]